MKKLTLNKKTVSNLNNEELDNVRGGGYTTKSQDCENYYTQPTDGGVCGTGVSHFCSWL